MKSQVRHPRISRQRRRHYFESHILRLLNINYAHKSLSKQAKIQINTLLMTLTTILVQATIDLVKLAEKQTLTEFEFEAAVRLNLRGQLAENAVTVGRNCLQYYNTNHDHVSKSLRAELIVAPSIVENLIHEIAPHCAVAEPAPVFLAGVIEYFLIQLLEVANIQSRKPRVTLVDVTHGIESDTELFQFLSDHNLFLNASQQTVISRRVFEGKLKAHLEQRFPDLRYEKNCFRDLQMYIEKWLVNVMAQSFRVTQHCKRTKMSDLDLDLICSMVDRHQPPSADPIADHPNVLSVIHLDL